MKTHSTNYFDTFIETAEDCPREAGCRPPKKENNRSVADLQFELVSNHPYEFTSDEIFFQVHIERNGLKKSSLEEERRLFFSKGQPCFRASPLCKTYGWGVHSDSAGKVALYGCETEEYRDFAQNKELKTVKAMRSKRK